VWLWKKKLRGQKNVFRAMNWCFEAGVLRLAKTEFFLLTFACVNVGMQADMLS
jgi:hypothetical protein